MAEEQDKSQQTEEPTSKRTDDARKKGQVPQSREPSTAIAFMIAASLGISGIGAMAMNRLSALMHDYLGGTMSINSNPEGMQVLMFDVIANLVWIVLPISLPIILFGMLATFLISGPVFTFETLQPKLEKVSPLKGVARLFSTKALAEFVKSLLKIIVISLASITVISSLWEKSNGATERSPTAIAKLAAEGSLSIVAITALIFFLIAIVDVIYQRWEHSKSLRMSTKEITDEHKETEGDPQVKARIRRIQSEQARSRMMADVPNADVIITNPTHIAVALGYEPGNRGAPKVLAKGKGIIAQKIREIGRENHIPLQENRPLARSLFKYVKLGDEIPEHLYEAVAIILAEIFRMKNKARTGA